MLDKGMNTELHEEAHQCPKGKCSSLHSNMTLMSLVFFFKLIYSMNTQKKSITEIFCDIFAKVIQLLVRNREATFIGHKKEHSHIF